MKRTAVFAVAAIGVFGALFADDVPDAGDAPKVRIFDVSAKQRYPWNGLIDIDYTITGATPNMTLNVAVKDLESGRNYALTNSFPEPPPVSEGPHRITWGTKADGVDCVSTHLEVVLSIEKSLDDIVDETKFYVVDLSDGPTAEEYPIELVTEPSNTQRWTNDVYKTTKLVLRRLEQGSFSYPVTYEYGETVTNIVDDVEVVTNITVQATSNATPKVVDHPFYIGVYEVTQAQWNLVMSNETNPTATSKKPKTNVSLEGIYGEGSTFLGKLRAKTGITGFDLPKADEWEYACRAGTTSKYNNGGDSEEDLKLLGRYKKNRGDGHGSGNTFTDVGSYLPNAWGLYDMHGNVAEWTLTYNDKGYHLICGGSHEGEASDCTSSSRIHSDPSMGRAKIGFRIICDVGL